MNDIDPMRESIARTLRHCYVAERMSHPLARPRTFGDYLLLCGAESVDPVAAMTAFVRRLERIARTCRA